MKNKGITLVALVVTIVIMLILAGVTINIALGENGLFNMAKSAVDKYQESAQNEEKDLDGIVEDLKHIIPEDAGKEVEVPKSEKDKWDLAKVTPTADGKGNTIPVPKGFYYTGGDIDTGFVISDVSGDDLNNSQKGNQFVWIPCTADEYKDAKDDVMEYGWSHNPEYENNGNKASTTEKGDGLAWSDDYSEADNTFINVIYKDESGAATLPTSSWEKNQTTVATTSVGKYGGFYIARFEAGVPSNADFYRTASSSDLTYNTARGRQGDTTAIKSYKPISQKGVQAWNYITQPNSKMVAENMYKDGANGTGESVGSYLVDSQAWNRICHIFDSILGTSDSTRTITNSTKWGNYFNNTTTDYTKINGLWALHGYVNSAWDSATTYKTGSVNVKPNGEYTKADGTKGVNRIELGTGLCDDFKLYNIYDMAGNMWEWTTGHNIKDQKQMFVVPRGGRFGSGGDGSPVVRAHGGDAPTHYDSSVGFRVVLYIK